MHYDARTRDHGLRHDPFKALVAPRPVGWIGTVGRDGVFNLAPHSFFNAVSDRPPMLMFSSAGPKDTLRNIEHSGEFSCSIANWALRDAMNLSSAAVAPQVDEFALAGLTPAPSRFIKAPRVAEAPAAFECKVWKIVPLPRPTMPVAAYTMVIGEVLGIYIDESCIDDGMVQTARIRPIARMGYMDYAVVTPETVFTLNRPIASADGLTADVVSGPWDGVYR